MAMKVSADHYEEITKNIQSICICLFPLFIYFLSNDFHNFVLSQQEVTDCGNQNELE